MALTDAAIRNLSTEGYPYEKCFGEGMSVRVSAHGKRAFQFRYRFRGKARRLTLGQYPETSCKEARARLWEAKKTLDQGVDPLAQKKEQLINEQLSEEAGISVKALCEKWLREYANSRRKRAHDLELMLQKDVYSQIGEVLLQDLSRVMVTEKVLTPILHRGSPVQANKTLTLVKQILSFSVERGYLENNPCAAITKKSIGGREKPRKRFLSQEEIRTMWHGLDRTQISQPIKLALRVLLVTGQRRGELSNARWENVDLKKKIWVLPTTKNGETHRVPLPPFAVTLFQELQELAGNSQWVLPGDSEDEVPLSERAISRAVQRNIEKIGVDKWVPHDLRRTFTTHLNEARVMPHVVEKLLNHKMTGILAVYNHAEYWDEQVEAMGKWGGMLESTICCAN